MLLVSFQFLHVRVEAVEGLVPELLETADPLVDRTQAPGVKSVEPLFADLANADQAHLSQHP
jgi:hypothetical protein